MDLVTRSTVSALKISVRKFFQARADEARDILLTELEAGRMSEDDVAQKDENLRMILRYQRAARDGVATNNLKLLAKIIRGSIDAGDLNADRCIYLLNIISEMTEEEIRLVWLLYKAKGKNPQIVASSNLEEDIVPSIFQTSEALNAALMRLCRTGLVNTYSIGGIGFAVSSLFYELLALVDLQEFISIYGDNAL